MGLFERIKLLARLASDPPAEPGSELGDLVEPGSTVDASAMAAFSAGGAAAGLDQLKQLQAAGLIDADTLAQIESMIANPTAEIDRLHASGMMSDEIYAQAKASMAAATAGAAGSIDAGELELLQHGESAPATVLALPEAAEGAGARPFMKLEVHPVVGSPYEAECAVVAHPAGNELKVGDFLQVKVDPADPKRLAVDWAGFGG